MIKKIILRALQGIGVVMITVCSNANAALLNVQDHGTYFTDTHNGLDWLDLTQTVGRSYNDVSSQLGAGGEFAGWRYATTEEFFSMWNSLTGESMPVAGAGHGVFFERGAIIDEVISLFGDTFGHHYLVDAGGTYCGINVGVCPDGDLRYSLGYLAEDYNTYHTWAGIIYDDDTFDSNGDHVSTTWEHMNIATNRAGSYLVRDASTSTSSPGTPVSAPATLLLLGLGMAGIAVARRK